MNLFGIESGDSVDLSTLFEDVDSTLTYVVSGLSDAFDFKIEDGVLTISCETKPQATTTSLTIMAYDGEYFVESNLEVNYMSVNEPPVINENIGIVQMIEDETLHMDLSEIAVDEDSHLKVLMLDSDHVLAFSMKDDTMMITPEENYFGPARMMLEISDGEYSNVVSLSLAIEPVNDPPVFLGPVYTTILEDSVKSWNLNDHFFDPDSSLGYTSDKGTIRDNILSFSPEKDWNGMETIVVTVSDGEYETVGMFNIEVLAVNDPPVISDGAELVIEEDGTYTYDLSKWIFDPEGESTYTATGGNGIILSLEDNMLELSTEKDWNGRTWITVTCHDGYSVELEKVVTVKAVNDPPLANESAFLEMTEDLSSNYDIASLFYDVDSQLEFSASVSQGRFDLSLVGNSLEIVPETDWSGQGEIIVAASDGNSSVTCSLEVMVNAVNDPPAISGGAQKYLLLDGDSQSLIPYEQVFIDPDGDDMTYWVDSNGIEIELTEDGFLFKGTNDMERKKYVTLHASDGTSSQDYVMILSNSQYEAETSTSNVAWGFQPASILAIGVLLVLVAMASSLVLNKKHSRAS